VSETTSPVDYSPLVTATILARSETKNAPTALVARCRGRRTELGLRMEGSPRPSRGGEILVAYQINDLPMVKLRWTASADGKTANYREDATALLQSFSEDARSEGRCARWLGAGQRGGFPTRRMERDP
jgi:hypothetical protein